MEYIEVEEVEYVAHALAAELMSWDEPIPEFSTRYPNVLERCVAAPRQVFGGQALYPSLIEKAAILFYLMVKNHPFQNGNKRIAVMALLFFLYKNRRWLRIDDRELYNFARWVAESSPKVREHTLRAIQSLLTIHLVSEEREAA